MKEAIRLVRYSYSILSIEKYLFPFPIILFKEDFNILPNQINLNYILTPILYLAVNTLILGKKKSVNAPYEKYVFFERCVLMTQWKKFSWSVIIMVLHTNRTDINANVLDCHYAIENSLNVSFNLRVGCVCLDLCFRMKLAVIIDTY